MPIDKERLQPLLWAVVGAWNAGDRDLQVHTDALDEFLGERTVEEVALDLLAEVERLTSRVKTLQSDSSSWQSGYDEGRRMGAKTAYGERKQFKAENEALRKDAERYRFVRNPIGTSSPLAIWNEGKMPLFSGMADAVVDEFMAKEASHD